MASEIYSHTVYNDLIAVAIAVNLACAIWINRDYASFWMQIKESLICFLKYILGKLFDILVKCEQLILKLNRNSDAEELKTYLNKELQQTDRVVNNANKSLSQAETKCDEITRDIYYMPNACLLLGLYGIFVLAISPFSDNIEVGMFLFNADCVCLFYLLVCIIAEVRHLAKVRHADNTERKSHQFHVIVFYVCIWVAYFLYKIFDLYNFGFAVLPDSVFNKTCIFTVIVCFGAFIVYSVWILSLMIGWIVTALFKLLCWVFSFLFRFRWDCFLKYNNGDIIQRDDFS